MKVQRVSFYLLVNGLKLFLIPVFKYFHIFDFVVLVYPGNKKNVTSYFPFAGFRRIMPLFSIIGFMHKGDMGYGKRGIIIACKYYIEEIYEKKDFIANKIENFANSIGARKIALVGRLPKILFDYGSPLFVDGKKGTVFSVIDTLEMVVSRLDLIKKNISIGVIGVGVIGGEVVKEVRGMGFSSIVAIDKRHDSTVYDGNVVVGADPSLLVHCDVVIVLTSRGDDIENTISYFKDGVILLDDTHPFISSRNIMRIKNEKRGKVYKVAARCSGMSTFPKLPGFYRDWIPGCVVETVTVLHKGYNFNNQSEFNKAAHEVGMQAIFSEISEDNLR